MEKKFELRKIMVCLDLSGMDEALIKFTSYIARMMGSDSIYFVHVAQSLDMPDEVRKKYPDLFAPVDETLKKEMEFTIDKYFEAPPDCHIEVMVREGNASDKILKFAEQKDIDLLVLGRKTGLPGKGELSAKIARVAHLSVLLVPEILPRTMDSILVPVDFSKHSLLALQQAIKIRETSDVPIEISCIHAYQLPFGWHSTGRSQDEFAEIMKGHAIKDYQKFIKQAGPEYQTIPCHFVINNDRNSAEEIFHQAVTLKTDIIILGSKGKTAAASALMGSTAEKLTAYNKGIPLLIVKDKNENIGFLQALFKI